MSPQLDDVDRGILHLLQVDARNMTAREMASGTGVSASTVRNRIEQLEDDGVIRGYRPEIDYGAAELPLRIMFVVTAPATERGEYVEELLEVTGVVDVRETLTGRRNIYVEAVGTAKSDVTRLSDRIHDMGLEIEDSNIVKQHRTRPYNHFEEEGELDVEIE